MSDLAIIRDGGMLIRDGKIDIVGASKEIEKNTRDAEVIDAGGKVVLPGFVDAHTHLVFSGNRLDDFERRARGETYEQLAAAGGGIAELRSARSSLQETRELVFEVRDYDRGSKVGLWADGRG